MDAPRPLHQTIFLCKQKLCRCKKKLCRCTKKSLHKFFCAQIFLCICKVFFCTNFFVQRFFCASAQKNLTKLCRCIFSLHLRLSSPQTTTKASNIIAVSQNFVVFHKNFVFGKFFVQKKTLHLHKNSCTKKFVQLQSFLYKKIVQLQSFLHKFLCTKKFVQLQSFFICKNFAAAKFLPNIEKMLHKFCAQKKVYFVKRSGRDIINFSSWQDWF